MCLLLYFDFFMGSMLLIMLLAIASQDFIQNESKVSSNLVAKCDLYGSTPPGDDVITSRADSKDITKENTTSLAVYYTDGNSTDIFNVFKEKYKKRYRSEREERYRLKSFVENLNTLEKLNEVTADRDTFFILNQYADLNAEEVEQQYAITIKPFFKVSNSRDAEFLGRQKQNEVNVSQLYNLENAGGLYNDFMKKYGKENYTKKLEYTKHFYRFVKTLVEINKDSIYGEKKLTLDENADVLKEPNEYSY